MNLDRNYWRLLPVAAAALMAMTGCKQEPQATETMLDVADVRGTSFDEPAKPLAAENAVETSAAAAPMETPVAVASAEPVAPAAVPTPAPTPPPGVASATPVPHATAADIPDDISTIPSETPVAANVTPVANVTPEVPSAEAQAPPAGASDYQEISFKVLSGYKYQEPLPQEGERPEDVEKRRDNNQIPADVKALDGKKAIVQGWMVPMEVNDDGSVKSFVLVKTQPQCCFGDMQAMNEWVDVAMTPGKTAPFNVDIPVKVYGKLEVGEKVEDGFVLSIYRLQGDHVEL